MHDICEDCKSGCFARRFELGRKCPCQNCLIKVMCSEVCEEWDKFYSEFWRQYMKVEKPALATKGYNNESNG